jgi:hypothetical protein
VALQARLDEQRSTIPAWARSSHPEASVHVAATAYTTRPLVVRLVGLGLP